jgi:flagellar biosynthesis/type III secretory pathway M-ring protein FliF/YscJ
VDLIAILLGIITAGIGFASGLISLLLERKRRRQEKSREPTLQDKISQLTKSLESSVEVITQIEEDVRQRRELVDKLEADAKRYENLLETNRDQIEAIVQTMSVPIKKESRISLWLSSTVAFAIALLFFALGFFLGKK